uniref:Beta-defensin n=1 Tax=Catagonus wagneri TaxID=51154 RepID=A0A8C3X2M4_9CETA
MRIALRFLLLTVHLLLFLLAVRSGQNMYLRRLLNTCWRLKGVCRTTCKKHEIFHIFCDLHLQCCIDPSNMPVLTGK